MTVKLHVPLERDDESAPPHIPWSSLGASGQRAEQGRPPYARPFNSPPVEGGRQNVPVVLRVGSEFGSKAELHPLAKISIIVALAVTCWAAILTPLWLIFFRSN